MTAAARVQAQAKINLWLHITPFVDKDGYHSLSTIFQRVDLADDIEIRLHGSSRSLDAAGSAMPAQGLGPVEKNLAYRAAVSYLETNGQGLPRGFEITLDKRIPVGGGLGGGSADAAAVLRALQALSPSPLPSEQVQKLAASLGADVPFLTSELAAAFAGGRGDTFTPFFVFPPADVLLIVPPFAIGTAEAYRWLDSDRGPDFLERNQQQSASHVVERSSERTGWANFADEINDFEPVIERRYPQIREYREALQSKGATVARMSGSGSTVFGIFESSAPSAESLGLDCEVIRTRTSARVVQVEVLQ